MFLKIKRLSCAFIFLTMQWYIPPCSAQDSDTQLWTNITSMGPINQNNDSFRYWLEIQNRIGEDISQLSQQILRPGIGYQFSNTSSAWLGYAFIHTTRPFAQRPVDENRIWQQLLWSKKGTQMRLTARSRLEERFIERSPNTAWRYRQLVKTSIFIPNHSRLSFVVSEEVFIHLNNFNSLRNKGFDQNRAFVGLGFKANKSATIEVGYLNQFIKRIQGDNFDGNYLALSFLVN